MKVWEYGSMGVCVYGCMGVWVYGSESKIIQTLILTFSHTLLGCPPSWGRIVECGNGSRKITVYHNTFLYGFVFSEIDDLTTGNHSILSFFDVGVNLF